jgi:hypothetical protein
VKRFGCSGEPIGFAVPQKATGEFWKTKLLDLRRSATGEEVWLPRIEPQVDFVGSWAPVVYAKKCDWPESLMAEDFSKELLFFLAGLKRR